MAEPSSVPVAEVKQEAAVGGGHTPSRSPSPRGRSRSRSRSPLPRKRSPYSRSRSRSGSPPRRRRSRTPPRRRSRTPPRYRSRSRSPPRRRDNEPLEPPPPSAVLGVFGLSLNTTERGLERVFGEFGEIKQITIVYDARTRKSRGFGFITFNKVEDAQAAREKLNGLVLDDRAVRVDFSYTKGAHASTPGRYMGDVNPGFGRRMETLHAPNSRRRRSRSRSPPRRRRSRSRSPPSRRRSYSRSRSPSRSRSRSR